MIYSGIVLLLGYLLINSIFAYQTKNIDPNFLSTLKFQALMIPLFFLANVLIGYGFKLGYKYLNNMTFVVSSSKLFDMLMLLVVSYFFFHEVPNIKTLIGLALVIIGLIVAKL